MRYDVEPAAVGPTTRTPPPPSTTRAAPRPAPRACSSPTATSGSTPRRSAGSSASATATSTCTPCRSSTATAGACCTPSTGMGAQAHHHPQDRRRRDPAPRRAARRHRDVRARRRSPTRSSTPPPTWDGPIPGRDRVRIVVRRRTAAHQDHRADRDRARVGVHPDLRPHRDHPAAHDEPRPGRARRADARRPGRQAQPGRRAGHRRRRCASAPTARSLARGNHIMAGYWEQPEATADAIHPASDDPDGPDWFHTGDGGIIDDECYVTISDRKKDVIISGGENVSSIEVEDAVFSHPEVAEVAVIGVPDEKWGELVMALVVAHPGLDAHRGRPDRLHARPSSPATSARSGSSSATRWPAPPPASCRSSSSASRTGPAGPRPSTDDRRAAPRLGFTSHQVSALPDPVAPRHVG